MILEEESFKKFGYYPRDLKFQSNKKILVKCDICEKIRVSSKNAYRELCNSCVKRGKHRSEITKQKMSEGHLEKHQSKQTKQKISDTKKGICLTEKRKQRISELVQGDKNPMFGIKRMGKDNPNWRGGFSFEPYCILFNDDFKERVREYWNRKCVVCDKTEKEQMDEMKKEGKHAFRLSVHHVSYNKEMCCDNSIPLFVPLCNSCHNKTNSKRRNWEKEFKQIIYSHNIDGKCFYSEEENEKYRK